MKIHSIPVLKTKLDTIPETDRTFYFQMGHLRNEVMVLLKFLKWSINTQNDDPILTDANVAQNFILGSIFAGKLWEGWELLQKAFFKTKLSVSIGDQLPEKAKLALGKLKGYFGKKNAIREVRNAFGFHYDVSSVTAQLDKVDESDNLRIYVAEKSANMFYQMSEVIVGSAMLETIKPGDYVGATRILYKDVMEVAQYFIDFCDGSVELMTDTYLGSTAEELQAEQFEIPDPPHRDVVILPFFAK